MRFFAEFILEICEIGRPLFQLKNYGLLKISAMHSLGMSCLSFSINLEDKFSIFQYIVPISPDPSGALSKT